jgi:hypothetical protein
MITFFNKIWQKSTPHVVDTSKLPLPQRIYLRWEGIIQFSMFVAFSVVVFVLTANHNSAQVKREYIQIALSILSQEVNSQPEKEPMRKWAADILDKWSPISLTRDQKDALIKGVARINRYDIGGYDYGTYETKPKKSIQPTP